MRVLSKPMIAAFAIVALFDCVHAHGGNYRGPGDVVPPGGRSGPRPPTGGSRPGVPGSPSTGLPGLPGPMPPGSPGTGGPNPLPGGGGSPSTGTSVEVDDLARWEFWWEFNKDPFIALKDAIHDAGVVTDSIDEYLGHGIRNTARDTLRPSESQITQEIVPALLRALEATEQRDIVSSCMVAVAKAGRNADGTDILGVIRARLVTNDQEVRETAAIALGISQMKEALPTLVELARDSATGRKLCRRDEVDPRTRAFAIYGLGLLAASSADLELGRTVFTTIAPLLRRDSAAERDLRVAAIHAMSLLSIDASVPQGRQFLGEVFAALEDYAGEDRGPSEQLVQAHVAPALAKLWRRVDRTGDPELGARLDGHRHAWLATISGKGSVARPQAWLFQSAVIALGLTTQPVGVAPERTPSLDARIVHALVDHAARGSDDQARFFAMIALGRIGGAAAREALLTVLRTGQKALERPWAAIALGVLAHHERQRLGRDAPVDALIRDQLVAQLEVKNPSTIGAVALGLGLAGCGEVAPRLEELLSTHRNKDELAGHLCVALALAGVQSARPMLEDLVAASTRRPARLRQAAIALGKLGDKRAAERLLGLLAADAEPDLAKMSAIASALGLIGDSRTITPLVKMLEDRQLPDLSRAFAAVALGGIADPRALPWNSAIGCDSNYRAAVETLTDRQFGILDIL